MSSPYASVGPALVAKGYSAIPVIEKEKKPGFYWNGWHNMSRWNRYGERLPTEEEFAKWSKWPSANVGIVLGEISGIVGVDFDHHEELWGPVFELLEESPIVKRGERGFTAFYRFNGEPNDKWKHKDTGKTIVDLLSTGKQTVIPPSIHPCGLAYRWEGAGLLDVLPNELPLLPDNFIESVTQLLDPDRKSKEERESASRNSGFDKPSHAKIRRALEYIDPDVGYETWKDMGMAIHSEYPDQWGFELFNGWSAQGKLYKEHEMAGKWRSFKRDGGITIATLFDEAKRNGFQEWDFDEDQKLANVSGEIRRSIRIPEAVKECGSTEVASLALSPEFVAQTPGLVGDIARWITETAIRPQPCLALGAALAAVGVVKGHRQRTETDLRTNLFVLGLAGSGRGKNHAINCLQALFTAAGVDRHLSGEPASEPGLIQAIKEGSGRSLIVWDEIGQAIRAMTNPNAGAHLSLIMSAMTKIFSAASGQLRGKVLATGARDTVNQPCLCIYGLTTPERFFETLTNEDAIDGFLARWLIFEVPFERPEQNLESTISKVPRSLAERLRALDQMPVRPKPEAGQIGYDQIVPAVIPFSDEARGLWRSEQNRFDGIAERAEKTGLPTAPIWVRAAEHAAKIALVVTDGDTIGKGHIAWALKLVENQCAALCQNVLTRIGQNLTERNVKKVRAIIRKAGAQGISRTRLYRDTQWLSKRDRDGIIDTLIDSEQIVAVKDEKKGSGPRIVTYKCI